jgi:hypothetical protein
MHKLGSPRFVGDGPGRLWGNSDYRNRQAAIETKIREQYADELSAAKNFWQRLAIESKIRREIRRNNPSPYGLWISH